MNAILLDVKRVPVRPITGSFSGGTQLESQGTFNAKSTFPVEFSTNGSPPNRNLWFYA